ncbi:MAG TPA: acyl-CoA desaturase [Gammaproteobacteria bacterium]|nr:acyl-CoA desaturase [Gammaproteobacteria bacterium]|tara:strand:+ start:3089 stop:4030 length:942 start_codon:yes stop_codon:yes gene_type:complete
MRKLIWGWIDSWADSDNQHKIDNQKTNWLRIIPFILLHIACIGVFFVGFSWFAFAFMVGFYLLRMFAITGFYHRYFAHKAFKTSRAMQFIFALIGTMSGQRGPLWWVAHHRNHHRHTDTDLDPHSSTKGFLHSHILWFLNDYNFKVRKEMVKDWLKFPELIWLDRFDTPIVLLTGFSIYALGEYLAYAFPALGTNGLQLLMWGFVLSTVLLIHATLCINSLGHMWGSQDFKTKDKSRNNLFLAIITLGEGWHNNHHFYAGSAKQGFFWWQIDPVYLILKCMSWLGLVWDLKPVPDKVYNSFRVFNHNQHETLH